MQPIVSATRTAPQSLALQRRCVVASRQPPRSSKPSQRTVAAGGGHITSTVPEVYTENVDPELKAFQEHQKTAARPTHAEHARTLMALAGTGVLSSVSSQPAHKGFPAGSVVEFALDAQGRPLLATSTLSPHTADLQGDGRCSITVTAPGFTGLQDARFALTGTAVEVPDAERAAVREAYLARHPKAFYVDFGDFRWFRMDTVAGGRYIGGFGRISSVTPADYHSASPDPVAGFAGHVAGHMNGEASHVRDMVDMVSHYVGLTVDEARMLALDRLGVDMEVSRGGQSFRLRLPFIRPAEDRKGVKEVLVEMTKTARAARAS